MATETVTKLSTISVKLHETGIAWLVFERPEKRNALNLDMVEDIRRGLDIISKAQYPKVVIFFGAGGKAFISGADIAELRDRTRMDALKRINNSLLREVETYSLPTIAAIRGFALGGGCEFAMACDLRVAGASARFGQPEVGLGILPGAGANYRLPRLVGFGKAKELILTGRIIGAQEAMRIGLVNHVVDDDAVEATASALADEIGRQSPLAVRFAKMVINASTEASTDVAMLLESTAQAVLFEDPEKHRRMTEFLERKLPKS
ncbi:MAG: enoyl-CoA hydratase/isomerase family protein [Myxococcales bacterium]|nr:enoyl-CoA hydratase/isomerase family protein [Myxococcales bacterium]